MPETPDFEAIGRRLAEAWTESGLDDPDFAVDIAEQLRLIWNTRGAVDIAQIEADLSSMMGATKAGPYIKNLDRSLRTLDR